MKPSHKLELLEQIGIYLMQAENTLLTLGMVAEQRELSDFYARHIEAEHIYICETQLPEVEKK